LRGAASVSPQTAGQLTFLFDFNGKFAKIRAIRKEEWAARPFFVCGIDCVDISGLIEKTLEGLGYELVDLEMGNRGRMMRVFVDKAAGINVDDCALISNHLTRLFNVENVDYDRLEVSSPGLDRPLKRPRDFARFSGERATLRIRVPINGMWMAKLSRSHSQTSRRPA
jgi:ribosome maturation factor RimP